MSERAPNHHVFASIFVIGVVCGFTLGVIFEGLVALGWFR